MTKGTIYCILLAMAIAVLFALNIFVGSVAIPVADTLRILMGEEVKPSWQYIILESRLPQAITATLAGGALAVSGLMLQTAFRNPLAGPSVFGINSGAGLGVALVMLLLGGSISAGSVSLSGFVAVLIAAFIGAMTVMAIIFFFSTLVRNNVMLLIISIMIGYISNSAISLLNFFATDEGVKSYMVWGMGSFGGVSMRMMPTFASVTLVGLLGSIAHQAPECVDAGRSLCRESGHQYHSYAQLAPDGDRSPDGYCHSLLWSCGFHRTCCPSHGPPVAHHR